MTPSRENRPRSLIFGYSVHSPLEFYYLRAGHSDQSLEVKVSADFEPKPEGEPILTWLPDSRRPFNAKLFQDGDSEFWLWTSDAGWFGIDSTEPAITVPDSFDTTHYETRLWSVPTALCFMSRGDLAIHASAVDIGGSAVLFGAPSYFGKTTLAAAFLAAGYRVLAEDLTCFRAVPVPTIIPGPAVLRLRPDTYANVDVSGARVALETDDRVHIAIDQNSHGDSLPVPLAAVVLIRPSEDGYSLREIDPFAALRDIWALTFRLPGSDHQADAFGALATLAESVPFWDLNSPRDYSVLPAVVDEIVKSCQGN